MGIILFAAAVIIVIWLASKLVRGLGREVKSVGRTAKYIKDAQPPKPSGDTFQATDEEMKNFYGYEKRGDES